MSYLLDLEIPVSTWDEAEHIVEATNTPAVKPLAVGKRQGWIRKYRPSVYLVDSDDLLSDDSDFSQEAFTLDATEREAFAQTVLRLGEVIPPGWTLRSWWVGDRLKHEVEVTATELAEAIRGSTLRRDTLYRVR